MDTKRRLIAYLAGWFCWQQTWPLPVFTKITHLIRNKWWLTKEWGQDYGPASSLLTSVPGGTSKEKSLHLGERRDCNCTQPAQFIPVQKACTKPMCYSRTTWDCSKLAAMQPIVCKTFKDHLDESDSPRNCHIRAHCVLALCTFKARGRHFAPYLATCTNVWATVWPKVCTNPGNSA